MIKKHLDINDNSVSDEDIQNFINSCGIYNYYYPKLNYDKKIYDDKFINLLKDFVIFRINNFGEPPENERELVSISKLEKELKDLKEKKD